MNDVPEFRKLTLEYTLKDDPNYLFLESTLVSLVRRHSRADTTFFSKRGWRKPLKPLQVSALRNLKSNPHETSLRAIAREITECASTITNGKPYDFVCGVPGGSSSKKENFASLIARFVAIELGVDYCAPLETIATGRSSSHPKQSMHFRTRYTRGGRREVRSSGG